MMTESTVREMVHAATVERCAQELETGLDVHRWLQLWESDGRKIDTTVAIAFYHQALQDGWEAIRALLNPITDGVSEDK